MAKPNNDPRPLQAIPGDGQETHEGWSGFIPADKFAETASSFCPTPTKMRLNRPPARDCSRRASA